ncbi:DUF1983 domain-containing protein, partial [Salmonella enterica]|uniref:DUF1983 domain-containing protein n=6 Tax=Salmonella enterica TaxID=28901 RepID=UPI00265B5D02
MLKKIDLTEDNASKLQQFSKEWQDANDKWNAMWGVKIEQTKDGKYYVAGLGLSMEDTPDGKISQFLVAADRIAYINPANGNETPGFVMQGDQIIMNEAFLKYLSAPTITSGGNPPAFSLTPDGKLTAKNADIRPGRDYYFYIRAVNQVGKSAFVEATGQASNDAAGYLDFFKGQITESHLGKELLEKVDLTEDNASKLQQFSKEWQDANDKWNAMWGVKIEQTKDGKYYVAGLGLSMEDMPDGKISQFLVAADRIAYINPANGNETPGFVMQGDQIIMNEAFLKYLSAPTITSGG